MDGISGIASSSRVDAWRRKCPRGRNSVPISKAGFAEGLAIRANDEAIWRKLVNELGAVSENSVKIKHCRSPRLHSHLIFFATLEQMSKPIFRRSPANVANLAANLTLSKFSSLT